MAQGELNIEVLELTLFAQNTRVLWGEDKKALVIDPGGEADRIIHFLEKQQLTLHEIWLTHSHLDHCGAVSELLRHRSVPLLAHSIEKSFRERVEELCRMYGIPEGQMESCPEPTVVIHGGETLTFAQRGVNVLFTPGHSPGHLCFYFPEDKFLIAGDTVFAGSIGRTDLPGGDYATLIKSIREEILTLPDEVKILPGHGPDTTVSREALTNPFLQGGINV